MKERAPATVAVGYFVANAGMALVQAGKTTALLVRLSDGAGWTIAAHVGDALVDRLWVDENEILLSTARMRRCPTIKHTNLASRASHAQASARRDETMGDRVRVRTEDRWRTANGRRSKLAEFSKR